MFSVARIMIIIFSLLGHAALQTISTNKTYEVELGVFDVFSYNTSGRLFAISINHSQSQIIKVVSSINEGHPTDISIPSNQPT